MRTVLYILFFIGYLLSSAEAKVIQYELIATQESINVSGKKTIDFALLLNQQIPAPVLEFTEGDVAQIKVINKVPGQEISIHWHGLLLDPYMDGVSYVNTPPIHSGQSFTFEFPLRQSGTYWYHSHTGIQEQKGIYGAFIIHPKEKKINYDKDLVLVLSDWIDENPDQYWRIFVKMVTIILSRRIPCGHGPELLSRARLKTFSTTNGPEWEEWICQTWVTMHS